jgi:hypothetical protein
MDSKPPGAKFNTNLLSMAIDANHSVASGQSVKGCGTYPTLSGDHPQCDKHFAFWIATAHPTQGER